MTRGWHGQPARHALAAKGLRTRPSKQRPVRWAQNIEVREGGLAGWSKDLPHAKRMEILHRLVKKDGYATVIRRLNFLINVGADKETDKTAKADMTELQIYYGGSGAYSRGERY